MTYVVVRTPNSAASLDLPGVTLAGYAAKRIAEAINVDPDMPWKLGIRLAPGSADPWPADDITIAELAAQHGEPLLVTIGLAHPEGETNE